LSAAQKVANASGDPVVRATLPAAALEALAPRVEKSLPVGNEGAGIVVKAGDSAAAQALLGRTVGMIGGGMYSQYRTVKVHQCIVYPDGVTPTEGASWFVNPLTALGMVETMRLEGHTALVHTAAASNLGQMLVKICAKDGIGLVNIVRKKEHVELLKSIGAEHVVNSTSPNFMKELTGCLAATGATLGFDATGGGQLASDILTCMERAANMNTKDFSVYGSGQHKQVYIYGGLQQTPTVLNRTFGMAWGVGGWLLTPFLQKIGREAQQRLKDRVAAEIRSTFASSYTREVSLMEALDIQCMLEYGKKATGEKYLINPNKDSVRNSKL